MPSYSIPPGTGSSRMSDGSWSSMVSPLSVGSSTIFSRNENSILPFFLAAPSSGRSTSKPPRAPITTLSFFTSTRLFDNSGIPRWENSSRDCGVYIFSVENFTDVFSVVDSPIMSISFAKSKALFLKISRLLSPVLRLSMRRDFLSALTPMRLALSVSPPRLLRAVTKSPSFPPFQLKSMFFSPT